MTLPGHRIDPPCGRVNDELHQSLNGLHHLAAEMEIASMHLKHLTAAARDAVAEAAFTPGSRAKLWRRIREFNACIAYSGLPPNIEVPEVTLKALITMLPAAPNIPPESPSLPPPSPKAAATVMGFIACLRRVMASRPAVVHIMAFPAAVGRIIGLLRSGSEGIAAEAAGLVAFLIGRGPGDINALADSKGEHHATVMHTKSILFANHDYVVIIVNRLKPISVSPLLSMAVIEVIEAMICEPHRETTPDSVFIDLLREVASLRRSLFALFGHPAESVRETVALIMRTIAEEDAIAAEFMRDAALRDGALLRHLLHAFSFPPEERCEVSRQLVALWGDSYQPALDLLSRVLPPGLVAYLYTKTEALPDDANQEIAVSNRRRRYLLQQRKGRTESRLQDQPFPSSNSPRAVDGVRQFGLTAFRGADNYQSPAFNHSSGYPSTTFLTTAQIGENLSSSAVARQFAQNDLSALYASPDAQSPRLRWAFEPHSLNSIEFDANMVANVESGLLAPAQVVLEKAPVGSGRLLCNWAEFWRAFGLSHHRPDLIWNERTRQELREALQAEVHKLDIEKERTEDTVPEGATIELLTGQDSAPQLSWNHSEFFVRYPSLSKEVCVGQYYLRLLLDSGSNGRAQDFPLRDPIAFFRSLYHRFLCDADIGLSIDGAIPDELGATDDWCDIGRLDGFGGVGGSSVRELCARAMSIVYEQHYKTIGPFEGTAHITALLDRTCDRALRHRLLFLLKVLQTYLQFSLLLLPHSRLFPCLLDAVPLMLLFLGIASCFRKKLETLFE